MNATLHMERNWHTGVVLCLLLILFVPIALAQTLELEGIERDPGGQVNVVIPSTTNDYFLLQSTTNLLNDFTNTVMYLGIEGQTRVPFTPEELLQFYRATRYDATAPADFDQDGIDDVYEIRNQPLNPLDGTDAALNFDWDTLSNLQEYLGGTLINAGDSDGDGFGDDDEINEGSLPLDASSLPVDISYRPNTSEGYNTSVLNQVRPDPATNLTTFAADGYVYSMLNPTLPIASSNLTAFAADGYVFSILNPTPPIASSNLTAFAADGYVFSILNSTPPIASSNLTVFGANGLTFSALNTITPTATNNVQHFAEALPYSLQLNIP